MTHFVLLATFVSFGGFNSVAELSTVRDPRAPAAHAHETRMIAPRTTEPRTRDAAARTTLDTAVARMGGIGALRSVQRMRVESMTEWQRSSLDSRQHPVVLSYEWSTEFRDYAQPAWRYTRRFLSANGWSEIVDLVVDSVAAIKNNGKWGPQNVAYVDERTEVFTFSPERLIVFAYDAADARALADTVVQGLSYRRVRATINGFATTVFFGKRDGALAMAQFQAAQPRDFGLAGWGAMNVEIQYSQWQRLRDVPINIPTQLNIYRVGKPYKRITIISALPNAAFAPDSMTMPDSLRRSFLAQGNRAMFDLPMDSARVTNTNFATFVTPGTPSGAIRVGGQWLLLEAGTAPVSMERSVAFLKRTDASTPIAGALITQPSPQAGMVWLIQSGKSAWVTNGAKPYADATMRGWNRSERARDVASGSWLRVGADSVRIESIDLPDYPGTAVVYSPTLRWAYSALAVSPLITERILALAKVRGWNVERLASARDIVGAAVAN